MLKRIFEWSYFEGFILTRGNWKLLVKVFWPSIWMSVSTFLVIAWLGWFAFFMVWAGMTLGIVYTNYMRAAAEVLDAAGLPRNK